jgi:hypothetical protein
VVEAAADATEEAPAYDVGASLAQAAADLLAFTASLL